MPEALILKYLDPSRHNKHAVDIFPENYGKGAISVGEYFRKNILADTDKMLGNYRRIA